MAGEEAADEGVQTFDGEPSASDSIAVDGDAVEAASPDGTDPVEPAATPLAVDAGGHLIVVGYDAWTEPVLAELEDRDCTIAVVATDPAVRERLADRSIEVVITEDVDEACFADAGIDRADGVLVATLDDQLNVLAVLTVMNVDPEMEIATFAGEARDVRKLQAAGADRVISLGESVAELIVEVALSERSVVEVVDEFADGRD